MTCKLVLPVVIYCICHTAIFYLSSMTTSHDPDCDVAVIYFPSASSYTWESTWSLIPKLNGCL